jgi:hypothetical protein
MALLESRLTTELTTMLGALAGPGAPDAADEWGAAWGRYFKTATHNAVLVLPAGVDAGASEMVSAMAFENNGTAGDVIAIGLGEFWAHLQANATTYWPGTLPGIVPAGLGSVSSSLASKFSTNNDPAITTAQAAANLSAALHPNGGIGGTLLVGITPFAIL